MKKVIIALCLFVAVSVNAQTYKWPNGSSSALTVAVAGTTALTISNNMNHVASIPTLTANITLSVTASSVLKAGSVMMVAIKTTSTETTTFAGDIVAPVVTGSAGKTWSQSFVFNGTKFYPAGAKIQVD
jgi:hypothetical protein